MKHNIRGYLENPFPGRLWHAPCIKGFFDDNIAWLAKCHLCQYGTPYKKGTGVLIFGVPEGSISLKCCASSRGICPRSGKQHLWLCGFRNVKGKQEFATHAAQVYPKAFAKDLMCQPISA